MAVASLEKLIRFVSTLLERHRAIRGPRHTDQSLVYAEALLQQARYQNTLEQLPRQIVVIGPTQSGKSTVVNLLLGTDVAEANTLAGFTRHGQGFSSIELNDEMSGTIADCLPGLKQQPVTELSEHDLSAYSLSSVDGSHSIAPNQPLIVWDTPDFDSVNSSTYRTVVPRLCALADVIVLALSAEKYADQTVWQTLRLIGRINRPLVACLNKTNAETEVRLLSSLSSKFEGEAIEVTQVLGLHYHSDVSVSAMLAREDTKALRDSVHQILSQAPAKRSVKEIKPFFDDNWAAWTADLKTEYRAEKYWTQMLDKGAQETLELYQRDYLQNPDYGDTIQRAIVRLLELLEVPGAASAMMHARSILTWPVRKVTGYFSQQIPSARSKVDHEVTVLNEATGHFLNQLQREAGELSALDETGNREWWSAKLKQLRDQSQQHSEKVTTLIENHQAAFEPEIKAAADRLYAHLEKHPAKLNGLRTARVTADAAGVVLVLKTGGIGVSDLFLTPAILAFTSMLTEGAVGRYMQTIEDELKRAQVESVETHVIAPLKKLLGDDAEQMNSERLYGIAEQQMLDAEQALEELINE